MRNIAFLLLVVFIGCSRSHPEFQLVRWPDGTNDAFAIENVQKGGSDVVIPNVQALAVSREVVAGRGNWRYLNGYSRSENGLPVTNEFWFALNKTADQRKWYAFISLNQHSWEVWCASNGISPVLMAPGEFLNSRSERGHGKTEL